MTNPDDRAAIEAMGLHLINNDYAEPDQAWPIAEAALAALRDAGFAVVPAHTIHNPWFEGASNP